MKDFTLPEHDLDKITVKESIRGIEELREARGIGAYICGGLAVSSYLPASKRRSTIDLDFTLCWGGTTEEFKELIKPFVSHIESKRWKVGFKRAGKTYDLTVKAPFDTLLVQHQRRSKKNFEANRASFEREVENSRYVFRGNLAYHVLSPEDIAVHKASRILIFQNRFGIELPEDYRFRHLDSISKQLRQKVIELGKNADSHDVLQLRTYYDIYDIKALAEHPGLNIAYFNRALRDWEKDFVNHNSVARLLKDIGITID